MASYTDDVAHIYSDLGFSDDFEVREQQIADLTRRISESPLDTRAALAEFVPDADEYQRAVIEAPGQTIRIVAPAGSGKTQTMVNRVLARVRDGVKPERILLLTFDRSAVGAFKQKLDEHGTNMGSRGLPIMLSTLNAYGCGILRDFFPHEYRPIIESRRQFGLMRHILRNLSESSPGHRAVLLADVLDSYYLEVFALLKNALHDPRALNSQ